MEQEKTLSNDASGKGLISKIHKQLIQLNSKKKKKRKKRKVSNTGKDLNKCFSKEDTQSHEKMLNTPN